MTNTYSAEQLKPADKIIENLGELTLRDLQTICRWFNSRNKAQKAQKIQTQIALIPRFFWTTKDTENHRAFLIRIYTDEHGLVSRGGELNRQSHSPFD